MILKIRCWKYEPIQKNNHLQVRAKGQHFAPEKLTSIGFIWTMLQCKNNIKWMWFTRKREKSCWWVIRKVTFATEGNSLYLKQFHHHIYWPLFTALKIQIGQQLIFFQFCQIKVHVYLLKIAISKLIILRCQTKYKQ